MAVTGYSRSTVVTLTVILRFLLLRAVVPNVYMSVVLQVNSKNDCVVNPIDYTDSTNMLLRVLDNDKDKEETITAVHISIIVAVGNPMVVGNDKVVYRETTITI